MTFIAVQCPHCQSEQIVKRGKTRRGTQRYLCQNTACAKGGFLLDYRNRGCLPEVKHTILDMSLNASGVRDTARLCRKFCSGGREGAVAPVCGEMDPRAHSNRNLRFRPLENLRLMPEPDFIHCVMCGLKSSTV